MGWELARAEGANFAHVMTAVDAVMSVSFWQHGALSTEGRARYAASAASQLRLGYALELIFASKSEQMNSDRSSSNRGFLTEVTAT